MKDPDELINPPVNGVTRDHQLEVAHKSFCQASRAPTPGYIHLKRYDLAAKALVEARRISPDDPQVEKLTALLDSLRPVNSP